MSTCPRCAVQSGPDDRFCRECGGELPAEPNFDDLEPRDPNQPHDPQPPEFADPVEFSGPSVPAVEQDESTVSSPPTMDGWSNLADGWYSGGDQATMQPPMDDLLPYASGNWQPSFTYSDQYEPVAGGYGPVPPQDPSAYQAYGPPPEYTHYGQPPAAPPPKGDRGRGVLLACIIVLAVLLLVTVGALVLRPGGGDDTAGAKSSSPAAAKQSASSSTSTSASPTSTTDTPKEQAEAVDKLLSRAARGKHMLTTAYEQANSCKISPSKAKTKFESAAKNRRGIVASARELDTSRLDNGPRIKSLIISMYNTSAKADDAFAAWAKDGADRGEACLEANAKRTKGNNLSIKAGKQKKRFVRVWNPVAKEFGHSKRSKSGL